MRDRGSIMANWTTRVGCLARPRGSSIWESIGTNHHGTHLQRHPGIFLGAERIARAAGQVHRVASVQQRRRHGPPNLRPSPAAFEGRPERRLVGYAVCPRVDKPVAEERPAATLDSNGQVIVRGQR